MAIVLTGPEEGATWLYMSRLLLYFYTTTETYNVKVYIDGSLYGTLGNFSLPDSYFAFVQDPSYLLLPDTLYNVYITGESYYFIEEPPYYEMIVEQSQTVGFYVLNSVYEEGTKTVTATVLATLVLGPGKATNPGPEDGQEGVHIAGESAINTFTWDAPVNETPDYLVYFRPEGGAWALQETIINDSTSHALSSAVRDSLSYYSIYEWRIDTRDPDTLLVTTGDTWTFISIQSPWFILMERRSDYNPNQVWQPTVGWVDIEDFEYTGGGRFKNRVVVIGHNVIYFGDA
jgi:hypothetical protein